MKAILCTLLFTVLVSSSEAGQSLVFSLAYTNLDGRPASIVLDVTRGILSLKVKPASAVEFDVQDKDALRFLKNEVIRLTSSTNVIALTNGYSIKFTGGYPIWKPGLVNQKDGIYQGLVFGDRAWLTTNNVIVVEGAATMPPGYHNYQR